MRALALAALLAGACAPEPARFRVGAVLPVTPRAGAALAGLGWELAETAPAGAVLESAAGPDGATLPAARLRFLWARAAAEGRPGVFFVLPPVPAGRELVDYPEEWQAIARSAREIEALRPVLESGPGTPVPAAPGLTARAWNAGGRRYALFVNAGAAPAPVPDAELDGARALFAPRADPRQDLTACEGGSCLGAGGVLWLEGRLGR